MSKNTASLSSLYENVILTLDEIDLNLDKAEKELKKMSQLRGLERLDVEKAQAEFERFKADYKKFKEGIRESAVSMQRTEYEKTILGKLEIFATEQLTKLDQLLGNPGSKIQNNEALRAVGKVVSSSCTAIMCTLNHVVATGKLAESVLELGAAVHDKVFNKDEELEVLQPEEPTKSRGKPLDKLDESLDMVSKYMKSAQLDLQDVSKQSQGTDKGAADNALETLKSFSEGFERAKTEITQQTADVPEALDQFYKSTGFGKMENFAKEWLDKATTFLGSNSEIRSAEPAVPSSRISKAATNVVKCSCNLVVSVLNQAVATGKVAESVIELGVVVKNKVVGQTKTPQVRTV
jgi:hypothetical protein